VMVVVVFVVIVKKIRPPKILERFQDDRLYSTVLQY